MIHLNHIETGDVLVVLKSWPDEVVQTVVTSPPYWRLRDYGISGQLGLEETPAAYVDKMVEIFREVRRVLKKNGTLWLNLGDSYSVGRIGRNDAGRKDLDGYERRGAGPNSRTKLSDGMRGKNLVGIPWRVALALQADGWFLRADVIWSKPNPMPESVQDRPTKSHEYIFLLAKSERYLYRADAIKELSVTGDDRRPYGSQGSWDLDGRGEDKRHGGEKRRPSGWASEGDHRDLIGRYPKPAGKWSKAPERAAAKRISENTIVARNNGGTHDSPFGEYRNKRSVWEITTKPFKDAHFATFPEEIPTICIKAGSREGDVVLDPFMGSGTTAAVAKRLGRDYVGIDLNPAYVAIAEERLSRESLPLVVE